jgi:hypothetical protein
MLMATAIPVTPHGNYFGFGFSSSTHINHLSFFYDKNHPFQLNAVIVRYIVQPANERLSRVSQHRLSQKK